MSFKWKGIGKEAVIVCSGSFYLRRRGRSGPTTAGARTVASRMRARGAVAGAAVVCIRE